MAHREGGNCDPTAGPHCPDRQAQCFQLGAQRFSRVQWSQARLAAAWARHGSGSDSADPVLLDDEALREEFLRLACLDGAPGAIQTFELDYLVPLHAVLERRCGDATLADETLQQLRHKLLLGEAPRLSSYQSTGHLRAWLQVVALRVCQDLARQRGVRWAREVPFEVPSMMRQLQSPGAELDSQLIKNEVDEMFALALREVVQTLPEGERHALRMHLLAGWNVSQIGEALKIHRATAARWIASAKERLNDNVRLLLRERLDLSEVELERLFSLMNTHLDLRLSQVFRTAAESEVGR
ncbi:MAG TPA: sigma-70 family RNA polymerase sigma factor [Polyangiaceae bacterium]|nr:sigma-70 family RNA polymerase sigma factor [Polyangiaceae bacterium]